MNEIHYNSPKSYGAAHLLKSDSKTDQYWSREPSMNEALVAAHGNLPVGLYCIGVDGEVIRTSDGCRNVLLTFVTMLFQRTDKDSLRISTAYRDIYKTRRKCIW